MSNGRKWTTVHNMFASGRNVEPLWQVDRMKQLKVIRSLMETNQIVFTPMRRDMNIEKEYRWRKCYGMFLTHRLDWTVYVGDEGYRFDITDSTLGTLVTYEVDFVDRNEKSTSPKGVDIADLVDYINQYFILDFSPWLLRQLCLMPNAHVVPKGDKVTGEFKKREQELPVTLKKGTKDQKERWEEQDLQAKVEPPATLEERFERLNRIHDGIAKDIYEIRQSPILKKSAIVNRSDEQLNQWVAQTTMDAKFLKLTAENASKDSAKLKEMVYGKPTPSKEESERSKSHFVELEHQGIEPVSKDSVVLSHASVKTLDPYEEAILLPNKQVIQHLPLGNPVISSLDEEVTRSLRRTQELLATTNSHNLLAIEQQHRFDTLSQDHQDLMTCCQKAGEHPSDTLIKLIETGLTMLLQKVEDLNDPLIRSQERDAERLICLIQQR